MAFAHEKRTARRLLGAIEDGTLDTVETWHMVSDADPTLVYFIFNWIRAHYPAHHPAADGVLGRLTALVTRYPKAAQMAKEGATDALVPWFENDFEYRNLRAGDFIDLVVEKLEG